MIFAAVLFAPATQICSDISKLLRRRKHRAAFEKEDLASSTSPMMRESQSLCGEITAITSAIVSAVLPLCYQLMFLQS